MTQRIIKFRAWDEDLQKMLDMEEVTVYALNHTHSPVMQFTGLLDKNGKEIYEGDIVAWQKRNYQFNDVVIFEKGRYWLPNFYMSSFDEVSDAFGEGLGMLEVIGNRYEHPTLISHPLT